MSERLIFELSRPGVMGPPALVFESAVFARTVATKHGGQVIGWTSLHDALFGADAGPTASPHTKHSHR